MPIYYDFADVEGPGVLDRVADKLREHQYGIVDRGSADALTPKIRGEAMTRVSNARGCMLELHPGATALVFA